MRTEALNMARFALPRRSLLIGFAALAIGGLGPIPGTPQAAPPVDDGAEFIRNLSGSVIALVGENGLTRAQREDGLRALYRTHFDQLSIATFVMGRGWQETTPAQRQEFLALFERYVAAFAAEKLARFSGEKLTVLGTQSDGDGMLAISQIADRRTRSTINVNWRIRNVGGGYKIRDVAIENVSLALTLRRDLVQASQSGGATAVAMLEVLRAKVGRSAEANRPAFGTDHSLSAYSTR
jgi:phospholipid transport system substrate-binding protein